MPNTAQHTWTTLQLEPAIAPEHSTAHALPLTSGTYQRGQVLGLVTATNRYAPYNNGASDGREVARAVARYACTVDSAGLVSIGDERGGTRALAPVYLDGYFRCEDLVGLDAAAVGDLGRLIMGDTTTGLLHIY